MDIQAFLNGLDKLFAKKAIDEVEPFLNESMENANGICDGLSGWMLWP